MLKKQKYASHCIHALDPQLARLPANTGIVLGLILIDKEKLLTNKTVVNVHLGYNARLVLVLLSSYKHFFFNTECHEENQ